MKPAIIIAAITLSTSGFHGQAMGWATTHKLPNPTATCRKIANQRAHCDVVAHPVNNSGPRVGRVYPLICFGDTDGGCYLRRK